MTDLIISTYSRSLPLLSLHLRYMTEASTLAGEKVLGSFSSEITLSKMVLEANAKVSGYRKYQNYLPNANYSLTVTTNIKEDCKEIIFSFSFFSLTRLLRNGRMIIDKIHIISYYLVKISTNLNGLKTYENFK